MAKKSAIFAIFRGSKFLGFPGSKNGSETGNQEISARSLEIYAQNHFWRPGTPKILAQLFSTNFERTTPLFAILAKKLAFFLEGSRALKVVLSTGIERSQKVLLKTCLGINFGAREPRKFLASKMAFFRFSVFVKFLKKKFYPPKFS